jgi:cell division protease FtsH
VQALLARETLGEKEILEVTGLPPAPPLESRRVEAAMRGAVAPASR